jgi:hypothetical protein
MNIIRINNLFRAYFIENRKMLLICCLISFGALAWCFTISAMPEILPIAPYVIMLFLAGMFFQSSLKKNNSTHFFNLPVSTAEKFIHATVVLLILGIVIHLIAFAGAYTGCHLIRPIFNHEVDTNRWIFNGRMSIWNQLVLFWQQYLVYAAALSAALFGSIYFRGKALIKTLGVGVGFLFGIALWSFMLIRLFLWDFFTNLRDSNIDSGDNFNIMGPGFLENHYYIISIVLIVFFLSLTYLRLRETEV